MIILSKTSQQNFSDYDIFQSSVLVNKSYENTKTFSNDDHKKVALFIQFDFFSGQIQRDVGRIKHK